MKVIVIVLTFSAFLYCPIVCFQQQMDQNSRNAQNSHYDSGVNFPFREDGHDLGTTKNRISLGVLDDLSTFSDADFAEALSKLSDHELDKLTKLMEDEEGSYVAIAKRENDYTETDPMAEISDNDQIASFKSWFSRGNPTKSTVKPTTITTRTTRRTTTVRLRKPRKKITRVQQTGGKQTGKIFSDSKDILKYGSDRDTKKAIDQNVRARISYLKSKMQKRMVPINSSLNRFASSTLRQKRDLHQLFGETGLSGKLEDSFPNPNQATAQFHSPLEPLVRVKRQPD
ncbi:uncharacterized protein LOC131436344 [Malaya genurostris]|uniref:uncharacterized protein LOC131436344 n=1 Tax=Malaya genurostris TaxID=325434 RepID=UPI0026F3F4F4|nr:uncharacterized protein LOC131436344 [Malaya genurostris]